MVNRSVVSMLVACGTFLAACAVSPARQSSFPADASQDNQDGGSADGVISIAVDRVTAPADGATAIMLTVTIEDRQHAPMADRPVVLSAAQSGLIFTPVSGATDERGTFVAQVVSTTAGDAAIRATSSTLSSETLVEFFLSECAGAITLKSPSSLPVGGKMDTRPDMVVVDDFNEDGEPDLAASNRNWNTVSVLLGRGDGTFRPAAEATATYQLRGVTSGDFNRDGHRDLAVTATSPRSVVVLLGQGDGTFVTGASLSFTDPPGFLRAADLNLDGRLDLIVSIRPGSSVNVLMGKGDGTFQNPVAYAVGTTPVDAVVADFNRDGKPDLAVANIDSGDVSLLMGKSGGLFETAVSLPGHVRPRGLSFDDFNFDGKIDLAVANQNANDVSILLGSGDGTFTKKGDYPVDASGTLPMPASVRSADLNGDGVADLVTADFNNGNVSVLFGEGDGSFGAPVVFDSLGKPEGMAMGDFNHDGRDDVAVTDSLGGFVNVMLTVCNPP